MTNQTVYTIIKTVGFYEVESIEVVAVYLSIDSARRNLVALEDSKPKRTSYLDEHVEYEIMEASLHD